MSPRRTAGGLVALIAAAACTGPPADRQDAPDLRALEARAEQGTAEAQADLGARYLLGDGVPRDADEALLWYRLAAEQDYAPAQATLGDLYLNGEATPQDNAEAARWYRRAAEQGHAGGQYGLGVLVRGRPGGLRSTPPRRRG